MAARDLAEREAVELPAQRLAVELGHQPADGAREAQVVARALGPAPQRMPRGICRPVMRRATSSGTTARAARRSASTLTTTNSVPSIDLAPDVLGARRPWSARTRRPPWSACRRSAKAISALGPRNSWTLASCCAGTPSTSTAMRRGDTRTLRCRALLEQALVAEQRQREAGLLRRALELPDDRLADLVRQLLAADLDQQRAERRPVGAALDSLAAVAVHAPAPAGEAPPPASSSSPPRPSPTTSR